MNNNKRLRNNENEKLASREMNELYSILHGWNKGKFVVNEEEDGLSVLLGSEKGRKN